MGEGLKIKHGGLNITFFRDTTEVWYDHLPEDRRVTTSRCGEEAIQNLMMLLFQHQAETAEEFQRCMADVREFYSFYLMDKSALNMLSAQLKLVRDEMP